MLSVPCSYQELGSTYEHHTTNTLWLLVFPTLVPDRLIIRRILVRMISFARDRNTTKSTLSKNKTAKTNVGVGQGDGQEMGVRTLLLENAELNKLLQTQITWSPL